MEKVDLTGCKIVDFSLSGLATPDELRQKALDLNLNLQWRDIDPVKAIRRYAKKVFQLDGDSFEGRVAYEDENTIVVGILQLESKGKKIQRKQRASIVYDKSDWSEDLVADNCDKTRVAAQKFSAYLNEKMFFLDHHAVRPMLVRQLLGEIGAIRLVPGKASSFVVPNEEMPRVEKLIGEFACATLKNSKLFKIDVNMEDGSTAGDIKSSVKNGLAQSLQEIEDSLVEMASSEKKIRPSTISKRQLALAKFENRVERYERALQMKCDDLKSQISFIKAQASEMIDELAREKADE